MLNPIFACPSRVCNSETQPSNNNLSIKFIQPASAERQTNFSFENVMGRSMAFSSYPQRSNRRSLGLPFCGQEERGEHHHVATLTIWPTLLAGLCNQQKPHLATLPAPVMPWRRSSRFSLRIATRRQTATTQPELHQLLYIPSPSAPSPIDGAAVA